MEAKDTLMDIDKYLEEMGWLLQKDGLQYAWLKQALNRQVEITFKAGIKEERERIIEYLRVRWKCYWGDVIDGTSRHTFTLPEDWKQALKEKEVKDIAKEQQENE